MNNTNRRLRWITSLAVMTVLVGVWITAALILQNLLRTTVHDEDLRNAGQAQAFAEYSSSSIKRIDEFMLDTREVYDGNAEKFASLVKRRQANIADIAFQVGVIDKDGLLAFTNLSKPKQRSDLSDREHFQVHKQAPFADKLFISTPLKGRVSGLWSIQLTRPIFKEGLFDGVLVVSISPSLLAAFNAKIGGDIKRSVGIINAKGVVLARYPESATAIGQVVKDSPFLTASAPISGTYRRIGSINKQDSLFGYYKTPEYGLNFVIGVPMDTVMAPYRQSRQQIIAVTVSISLLLLAFWLMAFRAFSKLEKTQRDLEQARDSAHSASIAKSEFLANMSHEIRTPMNAILGMLHLLHTTELTTRQTDYTKKTEKAARSLLRLVDDILNISKIEARKIELDLRPFELQSMLDDLSVILSANLNDKALALRFMVDPDVPPVLRGDDMRLQQVLINIGGNAIKFSQEGEILIRVQLIEKSANDALLEFSVRDNGIGVAKENHIHIFDSFSQADTSTTRRYGGTGLGLSISSRIVALLGGELKIDSALGLGSRFYFQIRLPLSEMPAKAVVIPVSVPADIKPPGRLAGLRLLVVEDNEINQLVAHGLLSLEGANITLAGNGQLGLDAIASKAPFDAVLMDMQMPVMDGCAATRVIRQELGLSHLPIIAMTANAMSADRQACVEAGMNDHIGKPFKLDELVATLQRWTGHAREATAVLATASTTHGIDIVAALGRLDGNENLFASKLHSFATSLKGLPSQINAQLRSDADPQAASRTLHTLKGLAATVGAEQLAQVAAKLESRAQNGMQTNDYEPMLAQLQQAIDTTLLALKPVLARYQV
ncbi:Sensory/regulatory protein RpfC [Polaromonas vacuolata]|uniref:Sensory/regulatory protein RpfC n=1 Tax=Polaromonas vacuolata TaxID=37448 RepID=A0A6H2HET9_9BURK|nr:hybrid sensor histidine kinase/response regulator [Polaromonas vacuolata]QJC58094.1 Sensory/regulatory protein RpfC [Polaromonas vacuolata]